MNNAIVFMDKARAELEKIKTVDEAKSIRDKAEILRLYAKKIGKGLEIQNQCAEIKIRAERKAGQLLKFVDSEQGKRIDLTSLHHVTKLEKIAPRIQRLRWLLIASIPEKKFEEYLAKTKDDLKELTSSIFLNLAKLLKPKEKIELPKGKYFVFYADPPWQYSNVGLGGSAEKHYKTLSLQEIINYEDEAGKQISDLIDENAILFLWVPNAFLREGLQVCEAWGFEYKTNFVWIKQKSAYGKLAFYNYGQHEFLFIAIKGSFLPKEGSLIPSIIYAEKSKHSKKPEFVYEIIESMYQPPYIELFARNKRENWESWGDEII